MQNIITKKLMSKKMTPVEWLLDQMFNKKELKIISTHTFHISNELANKAKEMEKEQIEDAFDYGYNSGYGYSEYEFRIGKEYYENIYKNESSKD